MLFFKAVYWSFALFVGLPLIQFISQFVSGMIGSIVWGIVDKQGREEYYRMLSISPAMSGLFAPTWIRVVITITSLTTFVLLFAGMIYLYFIIFD